MSKIGKQEKTDTHIKQVVGSLLAKKEMKRHSKIGKFFVTNFTGTAITSTAALDAIFLPALGTTDITRVGDRAVVDYVKVKGYLDLNAGNLGSQYARLICFGGIKMTARLHQLKQMCFITHFLIQIVIQTLLARKRYKYCGTRSSPQNRTGMAVSC